MASCRPLAIEADSETAIITTYLVYVTSPPLLKSLLAALCFNLPASEHFAANCSHLRPSEATLGHQSYLACTEYKK